MALTFSGAIAAHGAGELSTVTEEIVVWAVEPRFAAYADAYRYFEAYRECPHLKPRFRVSASAPFRIDELRIRLAGTGVDIPVFINVFERTLAVPDSPEIAQSEGVFYMNLRPGKVDVRVDAELRSPIAAMTHYRELFGTVEEFNRCEKKVMPNVLRLLRKNYNGLRFQFSEAATIPGGHLKLLHPWPG